MKLNCSIRFADSCDEDETLLLKISDDEGEEKDPEIFDAAAYEDKTNFGVARETFIKAFESKMERSLSSEMIQSLSLPVSEFGPAKKLNPDIGILHAASFSLV